MNLLVKDLEEIRQIKRQKDSKNKGNLNLKDVLYRIQLYSVKVNLQRVKIKEEQFIQLCRGVKKDLLSQPSLLKIDGPVYVCTGTLGNYQQLANIIERCGHPQFVNYLFLGDYAGRYNQSIECIVALFAYKLLMPANFFLLRGCYETIPMAKSHLLQEQLLQYFDSSAPWLQVCETFCSLPFAAIVDERLFCLHGGLSPYLQSLEQINGIVRPTNNIDDNLMRDLLWADPSNLYEGWTQNDRGISVSFGADIVSQFMKVHDLTLICRGHEVPYQGFRFFADKKMVTICSLAQYCEMMNNSSAVMMVDEQSNVLFMMISDRSDYSNKEQDKGLTFVDMMIRKKEKQEKQLAEEKKIAEEKEKEKELDKPKEKGTRQHKKKPKKE